jgi:hypothetical protein
MTDHPPGALKSLANIRLDKHERSKGSSNLEGSSREGTAHHAPAFYEGAMDQSMDQMLSLLAVSFARFSHIRVAVSIVGFHLSRTSHSSG